jgi:hypothetical protein
MSLAESANAALRFGLELCGLAGLAYWGFSTNETLTGDLVAGIGAPLAVALAWGAWVAPKAPYRLHDPARLLLEALLLGVAAAALADADATLLAFLLAAAVAVNIPVMFLLGQRRLGGI